jgi:transposase
MAHADRCRKIYPSDVTAAQWAIVAPLIPPAQSGPRGGHPRQVDMRAVLNTRVYLHRRGWQWARLPHEVRPQSTGAEDCAPWRDHGPGGKIVPAVRARPRGPRASRAPRSCPRRSEAPSAGMLGAAKHRAQAASVGPAVGLGAGEPPDPCGARRWHGASTPARPRHAPGRATSHAALGGSALSPPCPGRLEGRASDRGCVEVQAPPAGLQGFTPREQRGGMERTNAGQGRYRRHRKDYARSGVSRTAMMHSSPMPLLLHRRAPCACPVLHSRKQAAC